DAVANQSYKVAGFVLPCHSGDSSPSQRCASSTFAKILMSSIGGGHVRKGIRAGSAAAERSREGRMTVAEGLLHQHIEMLVAENTRWQTLLADNIVWELAFGPALGHPARLSGRAEVVQFAAWFVGAVENFRFFDVRVQAFAD